MLLSFVDLANTISVKMLLGAYTSRGEKGRDLEKESIRDRCC